MTKTENQHDHNDGDADLLANWDPANNWPLDDEGGDRARSLLRGEDNPALASLIARQEALFDQILHRTLVWTGALSDNEPDGPPTPEPPLLLTAEEWAERADCESQCNYYECKMAMRELGALEFRMWQFMREGQDPAFAALLARQERFLERLQRVILERLEKSPSWQTLQP